MAARNVYRGRVISLLAHCYGPPTVRFHELPAVAREDIVLPDGLPERLERHTIGSSRHREPSSRPARRPCWSSCTGAAWSCGWTAWTGWSRGPRA